MVRSAPARKVSYGRRLREGSAIGETEQVVGIKVSMYMM